MLSAEQLIVVAYCHDGSILCRSCGEGNPETKMGEAMSAYEADEYAGNEGLTCEDCGKGIVEQYEWTCPNCDTDYIGDEAEEAESNFGWGPKASHKCGDDCPGEESEETPSE